MSPFVQIIEVSSEDFLSDLMTVRGSYQMSARMRASAIAKYSRELRDIDNRKIFLCFDEAEMPVAYVQLVLKNADDNPELANGKEIAHIHDLRVRHDVQSRGYGKCLMSHLEGVAVELGYQVLTLGVEGKNLRAISFYEKLGYLKFQKLVGKQNDEFIFLMRKTLELSGSRP